MKTHKKTLALKRLYVHAAIAALSTVLCPALPRALSCEPTGVGVPPPASGILAQFNQHYREGDFERRLAAYRDHVRNIADAESSGGGALALWVIVIVCGATLYLKLTEKKPDSVATASDLETASREDYPAMRNDDPVVASNNTDETNDGL